ncbi:beta-ketoacyl synthase chain length factor [Hydrogenophaga sp. 5NK40-0174]|uniref:beta-ketoacyl synthase chain length factor n=1 Tax=Hydrogenophaga sp. 5NK40-0174 TaxID=3127649 RepID=UPI0031058362
MSQASETHSMTAWIEGVGFIAPGLPDWVSAVEALSGRAAYESAPSVLPPPQGLGSAERRRASRVVKLALALGHEAAANAQADVSSLATVFSASGADGHNCHALCEQLATDDRQISPTRFHNSVHNAAAGYWSMATHCMAPCQVLSAFDGSFGAGLIDAMGQVLADRQATMLVAYDSEYPAPLHAVRPVPDCAGVALVLAPEQSARSLASVSMRSVHGDAIDPVPAQPAVLESLRQSTPALRSLPFLALLAKAEAGTVQIEYLDGMALQLKVQPCR